MLGVALDLHTLHLRKIYFTYHDIWKAINQESFYVRVCGYCKTHIQKMGCVDHINFLLMYLVLYVWIQRTKINFFKKEKYIFLKDILLGFKICSKIFFRNSDFIFWVFISMKNKNKSFISTFIQKPRQFMFFNKNILKN